MRRIRREFVLCVTLTRRDYKITAGRFTLLREALPPL